MLQLKRLVERGVSPNELRQILEQLRALARSALPPPLARPPSRPAVAPPFYGQQPPFPPQHAAPSRPYSQLPPPSTFSQPPPQVAVVSAQVPPVSVPVIPANLESLVASLVNAGVLTGTGSSKPSAAPGTSTPEVAPPSSESEDFSEARTISARDYRSSVLAVPINLNAADLARLVDVPYQLSYHSTYPLRARPRIVELLYERQASQCRQCGLRFADTKLGKKEMDNHLDMHFRQNSKVDKGRGHSRSWYTGLEVCQTYSVLHRFTHIVFLGLVT